MVICRESTEDKVTNYNNYAIFTDSGIEFGIFLRLPIRKNCYSIYGKNSPGKPEQSIYDWIDICASKGLRVWNRLLGNKEQIKDALNADELLEDPEFYGVVVNKLVSPIYCKRYYRRLTLVNMDIENPIQYVESYGYNDDYAETTGDCLRETTKIAHQYRFTERRVRHGKRYLYTYMHIAKELIRTLEAIDLAESEKNKEEK